MTVDELFALGEAPFRYQLVEGCLVVNEPKLPHQTVTAHRRSTPGGRELDVTIVVTASDTLTSPLLPGFGVGVGELFVT
jgi:hypothetical protein